MCAWSNSFIKINKVEPRVFAGVCIVVRGVWWGPPWAQVVDTGPLATVEVSWDEEKIFMQIRGKYYLTLFPLEVAQENRVFAGVCIVVWGVWWGPPWAQVVDTGPLATVEVGWDEKKIFMQIRGKYYLTLFPLEVAQENRVFAGVCIVVWGVWWGPPWAQVVDTGPLATVEVGWDEKKIFMQIRGKYYLTLTR